MADEGTVDGEAGVDEFGVTGADFGEAEIAGVEEANENEPDGKGSGVTWFDDAEAVCGEVDVPNKGEADGGGWAIDEGCLKLSSPDGAGRVGSSVSKLGWASARPK